MMTETATRIVALGVGLLLCGCSADLPTATEMALPVEQESIQVIAEAKIASNYLQVVILPDGTRCVLADGTEAVAIDCNWQSEVTP